MLQVIFNCFFDLLTFTKSGVTTFQLPLLFVKIQIAPSCFVIIANFCGIFGGLLACLSTLDINSYQFMKGVKSWFNPWDAVFGLIKSIHFGFAITSIACYFGFYTTGGAQGVGKATMNTVVASCVTIVILDYLLAEILL